MFLKKKKIVIPNALFSFGLSKSAFRVYVYLSNAFSRNMNVGIVKYTRISQACHISVNTAQAAIKELSKYGLIAKKHTHKYIKGKAMLSSNKYTISALPGNYTIVDNAVIRNISDSSQFVVYCAIAYYANANQMAFPSYSQLAELTGLSRSTVIRKVAALMDNIVIVKSLYKRNAGMYGHNNYISLTAQLRGMLLRYIGIAISNAKKAVFEAFRAFSFSLFDLFIDSDELNASIQVKYNTLRLNILNRRLSVTELSPVERYDLILV